jgi:hypothetical protein
MPALFTTLGHLDRRWEGKVRQILPTPEVINDVVLFNVLIDTPNPDLVLMKGMSAQISFVVGEAKNVLQIPTRALGARVPSLDTERGKPYKMRLSVRGATDPGVPTLLSRSIQLYCGVDGRRMLARPGVYATSNPSQPAP